MRPYTLLSVAPREVTFVSFNKRFAPRLLSLGTALIVLSCGGGGGDKTPTSPPPPVMVLTTVTVSLSAATIQVGQAATASATGADQNGGAIGTGTIAWSSSSSAVASISAGGAITAVAVGQTTITATAGGKSGQATLTVIPVPVVSVVISPTVPALMFVGGTQQLTAATLDANNATLSGRTVTWSSSDTTKARVSNTGLVTAVAVGAASIVAASEGKSGNASITVLPVPVATVTVSPSSVTLGAGVSQQLTATALDANGATLAGRVVTWTSSDVTKATVSATGLVTAIAVGTANVSATSETKTGTAVITVSAPAPVATVTVAPVTASVLVGGSVVLTATARDASGNVLSGRAWTWTANLSIATGTYQGNVLTALGVAPGVTAVTATSEGKNGSATVTVVAAVPAITSVTPSSLTPGGSFTVVGTNFAVTAAGNTLTVGGAAATVTSASPTQLTATVPCVLGGTVPVIVTTSGISSNSVAATLVNSTQTLSVGQSVSLLTEASMRCNELPVTGGRYLISVINASTIPSSVAPVLIAGSVSHGITGSKQNVATAPQPLRAFARVKTALTGDARDRIARARAHAAALDRDRAIVDVALRTPGFAAARDAARSRQSTRGIVVPTTVGSTVSLHYVSGNSCNSFTNVSARVVSVTTHGMVLEDAASPTAGQVDSELNAFGQLFEATLYPVLANFGDVNAYDAAGGLDNAGKVLMLFTANENIPGAGGTYQLGHIISCDFIPTALSGYAGSNQTKIFYARVPKYLTGSAYTLDTKAWWLAVMPGTLVHEAKHLTSRAEHMVRGNAGEESWLEEGTAQIASEIFSRSVYAGTSWKGNTTYQNSIYCDYRLDLSCPNGRKVMSNHFEFLADYYKNHEDLSILSPGSVDPDIYGSAWMFARWLVDQYGGSTESTLLRALTQSSQTGVNNVVARTGQSFATLLADWSLMLAADDYPGLSPAAGAKYTFPSWNTRSIWTGYSVDFGDPPFPLDVNAVSFGSFSLSGTIAGASAAIIEMSGTQTSRQLLNLSALPAGTPIRLSILRVQ